MSDQLETKEVFSLGEQVYIIITICALVCGSFGFLSWQVQNILMKQKFDYEISRRDEMIRSYRTVVSKSWMQNCVEEGWDTDTPAVVCTDKKFSHITSIPSTGGMWNSTK